MVGEAHIRTSFSASIRSLWAFQGKVNRSETIQLVHVCYNNGWGEKKISLLGPSAVKRGAGSLGSHSKQTGRSPGD